MNGRIFIDWGVCQYNKIMLTDCWPHRQYMCIGVLPKFVIFLDKILNTIKFSNIFGQQYSTFCWPFVEFPLFVFHEFETYLQFRNKCTPFFHMICTKNPSGALITVLLTFLLIPFFAFYRRYWAIFFFTGPQNYNSKYVSEIRFTVWRIGLEVQDLELTNFRERRLSESDLSDSLIVFKERVFFPIFFNFNL